LATVWPDLTPDLCAIPPFPAMTANRRAVTLSPT
jgi:hypothetical protein